MRRSPGRGLVLLGLLGVPPRLDVGPVETEVLADADSRRPLLLEPPVIQSLDGDLEEGRYFGGRGLGAVIGRLPPR